LIIALALSLGQIGGSIFEMFKNTYTLDGDLPLHMCDLAGILIVFSLFFKKQLMYELSYFWGLGGTFQALLTPDLVYDFPSFYFIYFFINHGFIIVGVFYLTFGLKMKPKKMAVWRTFLITQVCMIAVFIINYFINSNYWFLSHKPIKASLLDFMGPWPIYIIGLEILGILLFTLLYAPFYFCNKKKELLIAN
jgi:hypothetical integral membrane protein (TIGR02206 family)